jgi:glutathione S-transferase
MHSGFQALRDHFPMNIEASLPEVGRRVLQESPAASQDLARIVEMWTTQLGACGGPFLFGAFSIADAYFAPVASRIRTYELQVTAAAANYVERIHSLSAMQSWVGEALLENDFVEFDEPYRKPD